MSARHAAGKFGFSYATSDVERILADPSINTVAILTRHNLHASQVTGRPATQGSTPSAKNPWR